jgi:membrane protein required for colicin V production
MLTAFDIGVGILVLISALLATTRGLTREILSLVTWAGAAAAAIWMWQFHPEIAREYVADDTVADIATVVVTFIVALIILHIITDSRLGPLDRTLGFVFGALRGILIAVVVVVFGRWLMADSLPVWAAEAQSLPMLESIGNSLVSALPDNLEEQVNNILQRGGPMQEGLPDEDLFNDQGTDAPPPAAPLEGAAESEDALTPV